MKKLILTFMTSIIFIGFVLQPVDAASYYYTKIDNVRGADYIPWLETAKYNQFKSNGTFDKIYKTIKDFNLDFNNRQILFIHTPNGSNSKKFVIYVFPNIESGMSLLSVGKYINNEFTTFDSQAYSFTEDGTFIAQDYTTNVEIGSSIRLIFMDGLIDFGRTGSQVGDNSTTSEQYCTTWNYSNNRYTCGSWQNKSGNISSTDTIFTSSFGYTFQAWAPDIPLVFNTKAADRKIQQNINDGITNIDSTLNDSSVDTGQADDFFEGFDSDSYGLTSIITAPLQLINQLNNQSCSPLAVPLPYVDKVMELPCMESIYNQMFGDFLILYQTITTGFISYYVLVKILAVVKGMKDPTNDDIEVMDL